mmetsp:Transcript_24122/g.35539  ORF Transcript_24122/g.35539 Transcript_24122/m.35539 type:complete len:357 (-) Transcript_24122:967-2037(-)
MRVSVLVTILATCVIVSGLWVARVFVRLDVYVPSSSSHFYLPIAPTTTSWSYIRKRDGDSTPQVDPTVRVVGPMEMNATAEAQSSSMYTVGICAIVKDAEAYIDEWVDYNFAIGFHGIYIYDNSKENELKPWGDLRRDRLGDNLHVVHHPLTDDNDTQTIAYNNCVERFRNDSKYIAFFDDDEFLVLKKHPDVSSMIRDHLPNGSLAINWRLFGTSNKTMYAPIPVLRRFQYREEETHERVKCIVRTQDFEMMWTAHAPWLVPDAGYTDTSGGGTWKNRFGFNLARPDDVAVLYHYKYKSEKEWYQKECVRLTVFGYKKKTCGTAPLVGTVFDDSAWKVLRSRVPKYRVFDDWEPG